MFVIFVNITFCHLFMKEKHFLRFFENGCKFEWPNMSLFFAYIMFSSHIHEACHRKLNKTFGQEKSVHNVIILMDCFALLSLQHSWKSEKKYNFFNLTFVPS